MITASNIRLIQAITPVIGASWVDRWRVAHYVNLCEMHGFADTDDKKRQCALRYIAGKRKITPPGHRRRKTEAKARAAAIRDASPELIAAVRNAATTDAARQFASGNAKAINALVGHVMRTQRADPAVIKQLIESIISAADRKNQLVRCASAQHNTHIDNATENAK